MKNIIQEDIEKLLAERHDLERLDHQTMLISGANSFLMSYFIYGYFGVIYQWIKYSFDETPEQVQKHISDTLSAGLSQST